MAVAVSWADIRFCATNNNEVIVVASGASTTIAGNAIYFITAAEGSNMILKRTDGTTVKLVDNSTFWEPGTLRFDGGFNLVNGGGDDCEIHFFKVPVRTV